MEIRNVASPKDVKHYTTERMREEFLIQDLFCADEIKTVYFNVDRIIIGGVIPINPVKLEVGEKFCSEYFFERREIGVINIGFKGIVMVDGIEYILNYKDGLYIGRGSKNIVFKSTDSENPAKFYFNSVPAHMTYATEKIEMDKAEFNKIGSLMESNERTVYKYIHPAGVKSCQLIMGMTIVEPGSVWNTMPCHTHDRRMETYLYFNLPDNSTVFYYLGRPDETRHIVVRNEEAVISPSWSIHSGCGTQNYTFIWGMVGENQVLSDIDAVTMEELK